tara:strand:+ start:5300 stop:6163 length:864 start_codon:yes stop_codon:yes gene_type:complete
MKTIFTSMLFLFISVACFAQRQRIKVNDQTRSFITYVPKSIDSTKAVPLVFNFHGGGMSALEQMFYTEMNSSAETNGFIVVYPQGIDGNWNVGFDMDYDEGSDDVGFVKALLKQLKTEYNIDEGAIFATGLSRGGFFTYRLAIEMPETFTAIASIGAPMPNQVQQRHKSDGKIAILLAQGDADFVVKFDGKDSAYLSAQQTVDHWRKHNQNNTKESTENINTIEDGTEVIVKTYQGKANVILVQIKNGGHTWPGADDFNIGYPLGKTTHDISMNETLWQFFNANRKK